MDQASTNRARSLRKHQSAAERVLWSALRANRLAGLKFKRQQPIGPYIVDFFCARARLIVELDGAHHARKRNKDIQRDTQLRALNYEVIRVSASDFMKNRAQTIKSIHARATQRIQSLGESDP